MQVDFDQSGLDRRFPSEIEIGAYRLIQEALTNVARHADVREVTVRLVASEEALKLYVVDNGVGFDADEAIATGLSTGLASMRERATLLGGAFFRPLRLAQGRRLRSRSRFPSQRQRQSTSGPVTETGRVTLLAMSPGTR